MSDDTILEVKDLETKFRTSRGTVRAVDGVSLSVRRGETLGIVGESGSGKSVLVRTIMGLLPDTAEVSERSEILYKGRDVRKMPDEERDHLWGRRISMVFQDPMTSLNPVRRIGAQIADPQRYHLGRSKKDAWKRAGDLLRTVGINDADKRLGQYPYELSGGMRQRVMIAIALACDPDLLIADEPTTALDVTVQRQVLDLLRDLQEQRNMAMILITHDLGVVAGHTDRVMVMYAGRLVERATTSEIFHDTAHRYTAALLDSTPRIDIPVHSRLRVIGGEPPDLRNAAPGCRFQPRCAHALPMCRDVTPDLEERSPGHVMACHNPVPAQALRQEIPA